MARPTPAERLTRAQRALEIYNRPASIRTVSEELGVSYGTAHALIAHAGGREAFRPRGKRTPT